MSSHPITFTIFNTAYLKNPGYEPHIIQSVHTALGVCTQLSKLKQCFNFQRDGSHYNARNHVLNGRVPLSYPTQSLMMTDQLEQSHRADAELHWIYNIDDLPLAAQWIHNDTLVKDTIGKNDQQEILIQLFKSLARGKLS